MKAFDVMSDMEKALHIGHSFDMDFVRSTCTDVTTTIFQILKYLGELAPGKYEELIGCFKEIQACINSTLALKVDVTGPLVLDLGQVDQRYVDLVGIKFTNLAKIGARFGYSVPAGFIVTAVAFRRFIEHNKLQAEINRHIQIAKNGCRNQLYSLATSIQQLIISAEVPNDVCMSIQKSYERLENAEIQDITMVLRSNAIEEDALNVAYSGIYYTQSNAQSKNFCQAYKEALANKYTFQAMHCRLRRGVPDEYVAMAVGFLVVTQAVAGGVAYSRNPLNQRDDTVTLSSVWGLLKTVVDGSADVDIFRMAWSDPLAVIQRDIACKIKYFAYLPGEGICRLEVQGDRQFQPSLTDEQAVNLAQAAIHLEQIFGVAQDIEWSIDLDGALLILQCHSLYQVEILKGDDGYCLEDAAADVELLVSGVLRLVLGQLQGLSFEWSEKLIFSSFHAVRCFLSTRLNRAMRFCLPGLRQ
ncbi:Phosphoenolpyruvate synthase (modular protein) [Desulfovibrionales bacterium]